MHGERKPPSPVSPTSGGRGGNSSGSQAVCTESDPTTEGLGLASTAAMQHTAALQELACLPSSTSFQAALPKRSSWKVTNSTFSGFPPHTCPRRMRDMLLPCEMLECVRTKNAYADARSLLVTGWAFRLLRICPVRELLQTPRSSRGQLLPQSKLYSKAQQSHR